MIQLLHGDCLDILKTLPDKSVQVCVTSPPYYGLRSYTSDPREIGKEPTPAAYVAALVAVFDQVWRVLRDDGTLWVNMGDSYAQTTIRHRRHLYAPGEGYNRGGFGAGHQSADELIDNTFSTVEEGRKPKNLLGMPWRVAFALQDAGWILRSDVIWAKPNCLSGGTMLYARTQKGEMPAMLKDLVRLRPDTVQLWNGERWTQVLAWTENPRPDNPIELTLRNGQRIGCTPDHLWPTQRGNVRADELLIGDVIQTCRLPEPPEPCDPRLIPGSVGWFVGLYIAEGSMSKGCIQISSHAKEDERYQLLCDLAEQYGGTCRKHQTSDNGMTINLFSPVLRALIELYVGGRDAGDKHLTSAAWKRGNRFLEMVLRGYLSGDAHYDEKNDRYRIGFTRNYNLESDLRTLCARLGYSLRLNLSTSKIGEDVYPTFRGELRMARSDHHNTKHDGEVLAINGSKARKFWDVTVADEPHLFSLASGVLTHNCMPESVTDRPTRSHEYLFLFAKQTRYYYDAAAIAEAISASTIDRWGDRATERMNAHSSAPDRNDYKPASGEQSLGSRPDGTRNRRTVWTIPTQPVSLAHFATMPEALIAPCVLAGSSAQACETCGAAWGRVVERDARSGRDEYQAIDPTPKMASGDGVRNDYGTKKTGLSKPGWRNHEPDKSVTAGFAPRCACAVNTGAARSVVLDPFGGSGTVARVADRYQRDAILIDLNADYIALQEQRTDGVQVELFV